MQVHYSRCRWAIQVDAAERRWTQMDANCRWTQVDAGRRGWMDTGGRSWMQVNAGGCTWTEMDAGGQRRMNVFKSG